MTGLAQETWRALAQRAGPSNNIPVVPVSQVQASINRTPGEIHAAVVELVELGMLQLPDNEELAKLASRQRISGEFVIWEHEPSDHQLLRVNDPSALLSELVARGQLLAKQIAQNTQTREELAAELKRVRADIESNPMANSIASPQLRSVVAKLLSKGHTKESLYAKAQGYQITAEDIDEAGSPDASWVEQRAFLSRGLEIPRVAALCCLAFTGPAVVKALEQKIGQLANEVEPLQAEQGRVRELLADIRTLADPAITSASRQPIPKEVQREVWRRDGGKCVECGGQVNLEYDHIIPLSKGGSNTARNIQLLCESCNRSKGDRI